MRTRVCIPRTDPKPDAVMPMCDASVSMETCEGERGEFPRTHGPESLAHVAANKRPPFKQVED